MFLKLFLLSVLNVCRCGKDTVTGFPFESGWEPDTSRATAELQKGPSNVVVSQSCQFLWSWNWEPMFTAKPTLADWQNCRGYKTGSSVCPQNGTWEQWLQTRYWEPANGHLLASAESPPGLVCSHFTRRMTTLPPELLTSKCKDGSSRNCSEEFFPWFLKF